MASYKATFQIVCSVILGLAWLFMALRYVARLHVMKMFKLDDIIASVALVLCTASCGCALFRFTSPGRLSQLHEVILAFELLYVLSTWAIKVSFCLTLQPILRDPLYARVAYAASTLVSVYSIFYISWSLAQCGRVETRDGCFGRLVVPAYIHAGTLIMTDLSLATLCILTISTLRMEASTKFSVLLLLLIGSSPFVATILRTYFAYTIADPYANPNRTMLFALFTVVEMGVCIIAAAATTLRPLCVRLRLISTSRDATEPHRATTRRLAGQLLRQREEDGEPELIPPEDAKIYVTRSFLVDSPTVRDPFPEREIGRAL